MNIEESTCTVGELNRTTGVIRAYVHAEKPPHFQEVITFHSRAALKELVFVLTALYEESEAVDEVG
jgi:hypothetical protein